MKKPKSAKHSIDKITRVRDTVSSLLRTELNRGGHDKEVMTGAIYGALWVVIPLAIELWGKEKTAQIISAEVNEHLMMDF